MLNFIRRLVLCFAFVALLFLRSGQASDEKAISRGEANQLWEKRSSQSSWGRGLQEGCKPFKVWADPHARFKGVAVLLHGYTACPNQFTDLAELLSQSGFDVYVPLLFGHGLAAGAGRGNAGEFLPNHKNFLKLQDDADLAIGLAKKYPKSLRVIGGLSGGGTVAFSAVIRAPALFDRVLLMAPYLAGSVFARTAVNLGLESVVQNKDHGWGPGCEDSSDRGRGGYCEFKLKNIVAIQKYANAVRRAGVFERKKSPHKPFIKTQIQYVGVVNDDGTDNRNGLKILEQIVPTLVPASIGKWVCLYGVGVPHPFPSVWDNLDRSMFWRESYLRGTLSFFSDGKYFSQTPFRGRKAQAPECQIFESDSRRTGLEVLRDGPK